MDERKKTGSPKWRTVVNGVPVTITFNEEADGHPKDAARRILTAARMERFENALETYGSA